MTAVNMTRTWRTRKSLAMPSRVAAFHVHDGIAESGWDVLRFPDRQPDCQARSLPAQCIVHWSRAVLAQSQEQLADWPQYSCVDV